MSAPPLPHTPSNSHFVRRVKLRLAYRLAFVIKGLKPPPRRFAVRSATMRTQIVLIAPTPREPPRANFADARAPGNTFFSWSFNVQCGIFWLKVQVWLWSSLPWVWFLYTANGWSHSSASLWLLRIFRTPNHLRLVLFVEPYLHMRKHGYTNVTTTSISKCVYPYEVIPFHPFPLGPVTDSLVRVHIPWEPKW